MTIDQFEILAEAASIPEDGYDKRIDDWNDAFLRAEIAQKKKQKRLDDCGRWAYWFDPHTGKKQSYMFYCDLFRECKCCLRRRSEQERKRLMNLFFNEDASLNHFVSDAEHVKKTLRNIGATRKDYVRYPQQDGSEIVILESHLDYGDKADYKWALSLDWMKIVNTPENRNKSGTLLFPKSTEEEEDFSIIEFEQFLTDADGKVVDEIMTDVIKETSDMNPITTDEVVRFLAIRVDEVIKRLRALGYMVTIYYRSCKLIHSKISWDNNTLNTENLTFVQQSLLKSDVPVPK